MNEISELIDQCLKESPCEVDIRYNELMSEHTTFKVGGHADCWLCSGGENFKSFCITLLNHAHAAGIPVFILGGGANIVVSDKGIRGIVLDVNRWHGKSTLYANDDELVLKSGTSIDKASEIALSAGLEGLEFLAGMPGTIGGAVWMNARCYGKEVADVLSWVEIIEKDRNGYIGKKFEVGKVKGFSYKQSPFQKMDCIIINTACQLFFVILIKIFNIGRRH